MGAEVSISYTAARAWLHGTLDSQASLRQAHVGETRPTHCHFNTGLKGTAVYRSHKFVMILSTDSQGGTVLVISPSLLVKLGTNLSVGGSIGPGSTPTSTSGAAMVSDIPAALPAPASEMISPATACCICTCCVPDFFSIRVTLRSPMMLSLSYCNAQMLSPTCTRPDTTRPVTHAQHDKLRLYRSNYRHNYNQSVLPYHES